MTNIVQLIYFIVNPNYLVHSNNHANSRDSGLRGPLLYAMEYND